MICYAHLERQYYIAQLTLLTHLATQLSLTKSCSRLLEDRWGMLIRVNKLVLAASSTSGAATAVVAGKWLHNHGSGTVDSCTHDALMRLPTDIFSSSEITSLLRTVTKVR